MCRVSSQKHSQTCIVGLVISVTIIIISTELEKLLETTDSAVLSKLNMTQPVFPTAVPLKFPTLGQSTSTIDPVQEAILLKVQI